MRPSSVTTAAVALLVAFSLLIPGGGRAGADPLTGQLGVAFYDGPGHEFDEANDIALSPDGSRIYVTGRSFDQATSASDYATVAYDASTGAEMWAARYDGPASGNDSAWDIAVSPDGDRVYVTGEAWAGDSGSDYATVAYDASTGARGWVARYNGPGDSDDSAEAISVSPDGSRVFVTGQSTGLPSQDYATVAYQAPTGAQIWVARYDGPVSSIDNAWAIAVSPDGSRLYVTGESNGEPIFTDYDYATIAYNASTGTRAWVARYDGPASGNDSALDIALSPDGSRLYVTGSSGAPGTAGDYATVAYQASSGTRAWVARYNGPVDVSDGATAIALSPDGARVFVTGYSPGGEFLFYDYATVAYDAYTGAEAWVSRYDGPGNDNDGATAIATSPDGSTVYVTGYSEGAGFFTTEDYATVAYAASTGAQLAAARFSRSRFSRDLAYALAVSPDGRRLYVTGTSGQDYGTVAYGVS